jgi:hypothetical protein
LISALNHASGGVFVKKQAIAIFSAFCCVILLSLSAQAQLGGGDVAFTMSTVSATSANNAGTDHSPQSVGGGVFPGFSGDIKLLGSLGVGGNISWRATRNDYQTSFGPIPFRPIFWDIDAFWSPKFPKVAPQLWAGIGGVSNRFYTGQVTCGFSSCTNFQSVSHFLGDFGGGVKFKPKGNFFIRPEATIYLIHNNVEFSGPWAARYGVAIGYNF